MINSAQVEIIQGIVTLKAMLERQEMMILAYRQMAKKDEERIAALEAELARRPPCPTPSLPTTG